MRTGWYGGLALAMVAIALSACSVLLPGGPEPLSTPGAPASIPPGAESAVRTATDALAAELGVEASTVAVVSVESRDWADTSLGCPKPGVMYGQVLTPGWLVVLKTGDRTYDLHTDSTGERAVTCG